MKTFNDENELPKNAVVGWQAAYECAGRSKHFVMRHFYMGDFPRPIGRVARRNRHNHKHWSLVWYRSEIKEWSARTSVVRGLR